MENAWLRPGFTKNAMCLVNICAVSCVSGVPQVSHDDREGCPDLTENEMLRSKFHSKFSVSCKACAVCCVSGVPQVSHDD